MTYQSDYKTMESLKTLKDTIDDLQQKCQTRLDRAQQLQSEAQGIQNQLQSEAQVIQTQYSSIQSIGELMESIGERAEFLNLVQTLDQVIEPLKTFQKQNQNLSDSIQDILGLFASLNSSLSSDTIQEHSDGHLDLAKEDHSTSEEAHLLSSLGKLGLSSIVVDVQRELQSAREVSLNLQEIRLSLSNKLDSLSSDFEKLEPQIKDAIKQLNERAAISDSLFHSIEEISRKIESDRNEIASIIQEGRHNTQQAEQHNLLAKESASEAKSLKEQVEILHQEIQRLFLELQRDDQRNQELSETLSNNLQESGVNLAAIKDYLDIASEIYDQATVVQRKIEQDKDAIERDRQKIIGTNLNLARMEQDLKNLSTQYHFLDRKNQNLQKRMLYLSGGFSLLLLLLLIVAVAT